MKKDKKFDYERFMKEGTIDPSKINRGHKARRIRREVAKKRITIYIDEEIIDQFKEIAVEGKGYQSLINLALREWLAAQSVKELIDNKITFIVEKAINSIQEVSHSNK